MTKQQTLDAGEEYPTEEDKESGKAAKCLCCGNWEFIELMHDRNEGWYCETCYEDIFL